MYNALTCHGYSENCSLAAWEQDAPMKVTSNPVYIIPSDSLVKFGFIAEENNLLDVCAARSVYEPTIYDGGHHRHAKRPRVIKKEDVAGQISNLFFI